jgi:cation:H+ antiporter
VDSSLVLAVVLVLVGFVLLAKGADVFVDGASHLAYALGVSPLFVGLTIVAFGTSAPELAINLLAAFRGSADLAVGNVIGSNIANLALIVGVSAVVRPMKVETVIVVREIPFLFLTSLALWFLADDSRFQGEAATDVISRGDGFVLLLFFLIFLYYLVAGAHAGRRQAALLAEEVVEAQELQRPVSTPRTLGMIALGLAAVLLGGHWVVGGSTTLARALGWSDALIGVTIVAIGTSLPEMVTSIVAARRGTAEIALGNVVGSNIFNTVAILGLTAVVHPLPLSRELMIDMQVMFLVSVALYLFTLNRRVIERWEGALLALGYAGYLVFVAVRG